jgi:hypothetical protein
MVKPHMSLRRGLLVLAILLLGIGFVLIQLFVVIGPPISSEDIIQALEGEGYEIQNLYEYSEEPSWPYAGVTFDTHIAGEEYYVAVNSCPDRISTWRSAYWFLEHRRRRGMEYSAFFLHQTMVIVVIPRDRQAVRELRRIVRGIA